MKLPVSFYQRDARDVAKDLIGCYLVSIVDGKKTIGRIIETEAYLQDDPASHSYRGKTKRNSAMFEQGGISYIYFTYGMYYCFNVVTGKQDIGEAVLIRSLEPIEGIDFMKQRRGRDKNLCDGPAKLVIAMGLMKTHNFHRLDSNDLYIIQKDKDDYPIQTSSRIGISKGQEHFYRYFI